MGVLHQVKHQPQQKYGRTRQSTQHLSINTTTKVHLLHEKTQRLRHPRSRQNRKVQEATQRSTQIHHWKVQTEWRAKIRVSRKRTNSEVRSQESAFRLPECQ